MSVKYAAPSLDARPLSDLKTALWRISPSVAARRVEPVGVGATVGRVNHRAKADFGAGGDVWDVEGDTPVVGAAG